MNGITTFEERLKLGNDKEYYVKDIFNLMGIKCDFNNKIDYKDIDLYLTNDKVYIDVKYLESAFPKSKLYTGIDPEDCLIVSRRHVKAYEEKREQTGLDTWICFFVNFEDHDVFELRFIKTEDIFKLIEEEKAIMRFVKKGNGKEAVYNINRQDCLLMGDFIKNI